MSELWRRKVLKLYSQVNRVSSSRRTSCTTSAPQLLSKDSSSSQYFIPCALAHSEGSQSTSTGTTPSSARPLLVMFKSGCCPKGLFGAVAVYVLQNKMKSVLEWELEQDEFQIFRDQICLSIGPHDSFLLTVLPYPVSYPSNFVLPLDVRLVRFLLQAPAVKFADLSTVLLVRCPKYCTVLKRQHLTLTSFVQILVSTNYPIQPQ